MKCPTCGAPNVILHSRIWECGWCGDSGDIPRRILEERAAAQRTKSLEDIVIQLKFVPCEHTEEPEEEPFCDPEVEALARAFPQELSDWSAEELREINSGWLLYGVYRAAPQTAITMWRSLLPADMETDTLTDPRTAEDFIREMELVWLDAEDCRDTLLPVLDAMEQDDSLARLVFQSAYVDYPQLNLLRDAVYAGRTQQAAYLFDLLQVNPLPRSRWMEDFGEFQEAMAQLPEAEASVPQREERELPDDPATYRYCTVQVGGGQLCAYLTGDLPVKKGDRVLIPYGKANAVLEGYVRDVACYTRAMAPWPPEETRYVLEVLSAAGEDKTAEAKPRRDEKPVQEQKADAPKPASAVKAPTAESASESRSRKALCIAGIAICLALVGLLIASIVQNIPETRPKVGKPANRPAVTTPAAPETPAKDTTPSAVPETPAKDTVPPAVPASPGHTFNYGGGSVDTGPGSGSSLREDYGDPEDLYEDGDYDDLDEAWDEWEEGW